LNRNVISAGCNSWLTLGCKSLPGEFVLIRCGQDLYLHQMKKGPEKRGTENDMNVGITRMRTHLLSVRRDVVLLALLGMTIGIARAQDTAPVTPADGQVVGDQEQPSELPVAKTPEERERQAWKMLEDAVTDSKHPQTRIQALAAAGMLRTPRSEKMITDAMKDPDVDVRTAAVLAAGQTKDRNLTTPIRDMLDDKEPQVVYTAAMTLWKMGDKSGEDILMSVVNGDRSASASMVHGTEHKINRDLHDPAKMAKLGAIQGAYFLLGPFGYGITAFEFIHQSGGDLARAAAIEQISQEKTEPIHKELIAALGDKDLTVRAAAAKALVDYRDEATQKAVYGLLQDSKQPVRLTGAAAYLRTTGVPGPETEVRREESPRKGKRLTTPTSAKPASLPK
jgi:HEAT repeat protein